MHNLFLVYFVNLYMFRAYQSPSSGDITIYIEELVLFILLGWLSVVLGFNANRTTDSHLKRIVSTNYCIHTVVPPDDGSRYARNIQRLTKYTKNKLRIRLVLFYTKAENICMKKCMFCTICQIFVWRNACFALFAKYLYGEINVLHYLPNICMKKCLFCSICLISPGSGFWSSRKSAV
jgi:hypothetical protein